MSDFGSAFGSPPRRNRREISWWYSLILVVALLAAAGTFLYDRVFQPSGVSGVVVDAYTQAPVADAQIVAGSTQIVTDSSGRFRLDGEIASFTIEKAGYDTTQVAVSPDEDQTEFAIRPNVVRGKVVSKADHAPVSGATVVATVASKTVGTTTTDASGAFVLADVPDGASLAVTAADYATATLALSRDSQVEIELAPDVLTGVVTDMQGQPVAGALVAIDDVSTRTQSDGTYRLEGVSGAGTVYFKAPGFAETNKPLDPTLKLDASLSPLEIKALYVSSQSASDPAELDALIKTADTTEVNALVVDLKDSSGHVFYNSAVPLAHDIGAISPILDPSALVQKLHEHQIYAIARIVVFEDPILAEARPDWAIHDRSTGGLWRTWNGLAWVNAHRPEVWDYDIALAKEAVAFGFDEIQLDYIRFPTDGVLANADYGVTQNDESRADAIDGFLTKIYAAIAPTHAFLAADVFGLTLWETGDGGIGQHLESMIEHLDYICPMIYPSHFGEGSMGFDIPNDHPYEVILWSLQNGAERIPEQKAKLRPWLQDFSLGEGIAYGANEVKRQIDATNDAGGTGWMLWNASNVYQQAALGPN